MKKNSVARCSDHNSLLIYFYIYIYLYISIAELVIKKPYHQHLRGWYIFYYLLHPMMNIFLQVLRKDMLFYPCLPGPHTAANA